MYPTRVLPDLGKLPHFGEILPMAGDKNYGMGNSAARFGDLSPFGRLFEPFGDQYFSLATLKFGYFLGYFSIIVIKTCLNRFLA